MTGRDVLRELAEQKILDCAGQPLGAVGEAAADLLADLYAAGLAHGVTPQDWAAVTALPAACWDASVALTDVARGRPANPCGRTSACRRCRVLRSLCREKPTTPAPYSRQQRNRSGARSRPLAGFDDEIGRRVASDA